MAVLRPVKVMRNPTSVEVAIVGDVEVSLLDLPELVLDSILERLSPAELCRVAGVCSYMRAKCRSNHMWEKHMKRKWGRVIGNTAYREWQWHMASNRRKYLLSGSNRGGILGSIFSFWPLSFVRPKLESRGEFKHCLPPDSIMYWYLSLESGEFWFPAQVYNRENGHDGFMLSCYDAELSYNAKTDTFRARYSPHGRRTIEENISWSRLRAPPVDNPPYVLHVSDCLDDLQPGDHFEIQWRRNREYPYGWWYGVVGHLESCSQNQSHCLCHDSDMVILEFSQYAPDSRWRRIRVNRKSHREEGNEADGFYGGIRKICSEEEISTWKSLWPTKVHLTENEGDDAEGIELHSTMSIREISSIFVRDISSCVFLKIVLRLQRLMVVGCQRQSSPLLLRIMRLDLVLGCTYNDILFEEPSRHKKNHSELKQRF